jgi:hypothetical protein
MAIQKRVVDGLASNRPKSLRVGIKRLRTAGYEPSVCQKALIHKTRTHAYAARIILLLLAAAGTDACGTEPKVSSSQSASWKSAARGGAVYTIATLAKIQPDC